MKKYTVSAKRVRRIGSKMTRGRIKQMKVRNQYIDENKQMTTQQQQKIKEFEDLFM